MLDACYLTTVVQNVKQFVTKVVKCNQSSILTSIQNTKLLLLYLLPKSDRRQKMVFVFGEIIE
jgi:hypothetical protein